MKTIQDIKRLPVRDYLSERGLRPTKDNPRYGLYLSPLRKEQTPSFKIDYTQNLWYDFGLGVGGSIVDLVMRLEKCDFTQAVRLLGSGERTPIVVPAPSSGSPTLPALRILSDIRLRHPALVGYLSSRAIDPTIASAYCREVHYAVLKREYFAIGFRNDAGGWELRSERFKGSVSPKHITTIENRSNTAIAFEGFMDFLSYLSMKQPERLRIDAAVLNSVVNLPKAIPFLERHPTIHTFFDNDDAGRKAIAELKRLCPNSTVADQSFLYRNLKYRYIKMKGEATPDRITELEERFEIDRDNTKIRQMKKDVEEYEWTIRQKIVLEEQARLKEREVNHLNENASRLKNK